MVQILRIGSHVCDHKTNKFLAKSHFSKGLLEDILTYRE